MTLRWWQWRAKRRCPHPRLVGIYGDLANRTPGYRRLLCLRCARYLDGPVRLAATRSWEDDL